MGEKAKQRNKEVKKPFCFLKKKCKLCFELKNSDEIII